MQGYRHASPIEREDTVTDTIITREGEKLEGNLHPLRITLLEEYGDRLLVMSLDEAEAFEKSSGYALEDIIPDFMFGEVVAYLKHKGAF